MTRAALALVLAGCTGPAMHRLGTPSAPSTAPIPSGCPASCDRTQKREAQTWREVEGAPGDRVRIVVTGDAGVRDGALSRSPAIATGPLRVAAVASEVCDGECAASVFLGDNLYPAGIGTGARGERDRASLREFRDAYAFTAHAYFALGNHDWGAYPTALTAICRLGFCDEIGRPSRSRAHRQLDAIRQMSDSHGDAHFWETELGPLHAVALDTVFLARRCRGDDVRCRGDRIGDQPLKEAVKTMVTRADKPRTVVFGHHPWVGHGEHGSAGSYRDMGPFSLGKGQALRALLDGQVAPESALYFAGHDHSVQVHDDDRGTLSVVLGAGGKTSPPGRHTGPGESRSESLAFEAWCRLGFAIVDAGPTDLAVQIYTLEAPDDHDEGCPDVAPERRPSYWEAQSSRPDETLGTTPPEGSQGHDLRCVRWELVGERWSGMRACESVSPRTDE